MTGDPVPVAPDDILHASCVAVDGKAVLIMGAAGSGKSALALELMSRGALLVADDQTCIVLRQRGVVAFAPLPLLGKIEARYVGILSAVVAPPSPVSLVIDLNQVEEDRLPQAHSCDLLGRSFPLLRKVEGPHLATAVFQYLMHGPWNPK